MKMVLPRAETAKENTHQVSFFCANHVLFLPQHSMVPSLNTALSMWQSNHSLLERHDAHFLGSQLHFGPRPPGHFAVFGGGSSDRTFLHKKTRGSKRRVF